MIGHESHQIPVSFLSCVDWFSEWRTTSLLLARRPVKLLESTSLLWVCLRHLLWSLSYPWSFSKVCSVAVSVDLCEINFHRLVEIVQWELLSQPWRQFYEWLIQFPPSNKSIVRLTSSLYWFLSGMEIKQFLYYAGFLLVAILRL